MSKEYGLIIPNKNKGHVVSNVVKKPSIFEEDSDSDGDTEKPTGLTKNLKRQDRVVQEKAVEEDPTVYQYDEVYDDMDQKRKDSKLSRKDLDKKPKYIGRLLVAADRRKRENERRIERQVQREREAEGEQFKDKESFVTSAYKKKLEELKELEEQEKREDYLESIGDVRKQGNLDGFYRHLYDQKVNKTGDEDDVSKTIKSEITTEENAEKSGVENTDDAEKPSEENTEKASKENTGNEEKPSKENTDNAGKTSKENINNAGKTSKENKKNTENQHISDSEDDNVEKQKESRKNKKRQYRKREDSKSNDEDEAKELSHLPSNLDADSDFSIDSESDSDGEPKVKKEKKVIEEEKTEVKEEQSVNNVEIKEEKVEVANGEVVAEEKPKKPKIDIWKKRTVGVVFDEALQRYYERKALRESG